jgi:hypothetical protein
VWERNRDYLKGDFARKVFPNPDDRRAFQLLVDQVPNIKLYIKSGMLRSGADLTRALASPDTGYLIRNYVDVVANVTNNGMLERAVPVMLRYLQMRDAADFGEDKQTVVDELENRRRLAKGTAALTRMLDALLEPAKPGDYDTTTAHKLLVPFTNLVKEEKREQTDRLIAKISGEILSTPDEKINRFFAEVDTGNGRTHRMETMRAAAELLKNEKLPDVVGNVRRFFDDGAVKPALDFFQKKIDDGTLDRVLLFVRRVLGLRGNP